MSDAVKLSLTRLGVIVGVISGLAGLFSAWFILPYRMAAAETAIKAVQEQAYTDHSLLQRIDERTARMERALDRLPR